MTTIKVRIISLDLTFDVNISDDDDEHSYHFRGKPELLAGISEENLLEQLEIEYLGDITSCNKVENYLMCSEYEKHNLEMISEDESFTSSQAHSEQLSAPLHSKRTSGLAKTNHSFSEPDLFRLFSKYRSVLQISLQSVSMICFRSPKFKSAKDNSRHWQKSGQHKPKLTEMPVILETNPSISVEIE